MSAIDPVCGAEVSAESAYAIEAYGPLALHFCSQDCHERYLANPASFVSQDAGDTDHVFTTQDQPQMPQPWRDDGDLDGPPTKR